METNLLFHSRNGGFSVKPNRHFPFSLGDYIRQNHKRFRLGQLFNPVFDWAGSFSDQANPMKTVNPLATVIR